MRLFRKYSDDEQVKKFERQSQKRLKKFFDTSKGNDVFPGDSQILSEDNIHAVKYEQLNDSSGRIYIDYVVNMGFFVKDLVRVRLLVYHIGSILCAGIKSKKQIAKIEKSKIEVSFFPKRKKIRFPIENGEPMEIECKKLIIEKFDRFCLHENKLIPLSEKLYLLKDIL